MRFVDLTEDEIKSPYDRILKIGCGPNFVLNRLDSFELMIKEQGITFWFRFWLRFSLNPLSAALREINNKWPDKISSMTIRIHKHFLEGSTDDTVRYCLEKLMMQLRNPKHRQTRIEEKKLKFEFTKLLQECVEMSFGAALCEVFSIWLNSSDGNGNGNYWSIPQEYLDPEFEAKELEKFIIEYWKEGLMPLLGIKLVRQIPWLLRWTTECTGALKSKSTVSSFEDGIDMEEFIYLSPYLLNIAQITDSLRRHRDEMRHMIFKVDEVPDMAKIWSIAKLASKMEHVQKKVKMLSMLLEKFSREKTFEDTDEKSDLRENENTGICQIRYCVCCAKDIEAAGYLRICKRCVAENWSEKRYYCSDACQMEHWFQEHHNEHIESMRKIATEIYKKGKHLNPKQD
uniref:MYND-type domain-containing protein n=1 Tax=Strigamia maritima TaxID=126957 RepID=T1JK33_STRMM